jgi:hypothetical protein
MTITNSTIINIGCHSTIKNMHKTGNQTEETLKHFKAFSVCEGRGAFVLSFKYL